MTHFKAMEYFKFVYCLVALQCTLLYFHELAVQLQCHTSDNATSVIQTLKEVISVI